MDFRRLKFLIICCLFVGVASSSYAWQRTSNCVDGDGILQQQQRQLSDYNRIAIQGAYTIIITAGKDYSFTISGDSNLLEHVISRVDDRQLRIGNDLSLCMKQPLKITLQLPELSGFYAEGAHEVTLNQLAGSRFDLEMDGASLAEANGAVDQLTLKISGTSSLDASELKVAKVVVGAEGTTTAKVHATDSLKVTASGIAEVLYLGRPEIVDNQLTGLAEVAPL